MVSNMVLRQARPRRRVRDKSRHSLPSHLVNSASCAGICILSPASEYTCPFLRVRTCTGSGVRAVEPLIGRWLTTACHESNDAAAQPSSESARWGRLLGTDLRSRDHRSSTVRSKGRGMFVTLILAWGGLKRVGTDSRKEVTGAKDGCLTK